MYFFVFQNEPFASGLIFGQYLIKKIIIFIYIEILIGYLSKRIENDY